MGDKKCNTRFQRQDITDVEWKIRDIFYCEGAMADFVTIEDKSSFATKLCQVEVYGTPIGRRF